MVERDGRHPRAGGRAPTRRTSTTRYYEVWLLEPDVSGLVPLGTTQAGTTVFEIPAGLDLDQFPVVDVSVEPLDGDPAHSGDSVVRGVLES